MKTLAGQTPEDDEQTIVDARLAVARAARRDPLAAALARSVRERCCSPKGGPSARGDTREYPSRSLAPAAETAAIVARQPAAPPVAAGPCKDIDPRPHPPLLRMGSVHPAVREAQRKLNLAKSGDVNAPLKPDCIFGPLTRAAVLAFQQAQFPDPKEHDGKIGAKTWAKLDAVGPGPAPPPPPPPPPAPVLSVTVPAHVRGDASPAAMKDRIPPRVDTKVRVEITGRKTSDPPVVLTVDGAGGGNGTVKIDGAATKSMKFSGTVKLRGGVQTDAGKGGALKLVAHHAGSQLAASAGFSVSAIPQNYRDVFARLITGNARGFVVRDSWESDSGRVRDLNQAEISEQVEVTSATGCFTGLGKSNSGYLPATDFSEDTHSTPVAPLTSPGKRVAQQTCMFKDKRSGSTDIPMTRSGYEVVREVSAAKGGGFKLRTTKNGKATTANGIASAAGAGSIDKTQKV